MRTIQPEQAQALLLAFQTDWSRFQFVTDDSALRTMASELISKHWKSGLGTLDSIQLASALHIRTKIEVFKTADVVLAEIAKQEGFRI